MTPSHAFRLLVEVVPPRGNQDSSPLGERGHVLDCATSEPGGSQRPDLIDFRTTADNTEPESSSDRHHTRCPVLISLHRTPNGVWHQISTATRREILLQARLNGFHLNRSVQVHYHLKKERDSNVHSEPGDSLRGWQMHVLRVQTSHATRNECPSYALQWYTIQRLEIGADHMRRHHRDRTCPVQPHARPAQLHAAKWVWLTTDRLWLELFFVTCALALFLRTVHRGQFTCTHACMTWNMDVPACSRRFDGVPGDLPCRLPNPLRSR